MRHFVNSLANSATVTVLTSLAMTLKNRGAVEFTVWLPNWLISWTIVFTYVYFVAPRVAKIILKRISE